MSAVALAQSSQDFASKFMEMCDVDTAVQCITVSPKMMEQLTKYPDSERDEHLMQAIQKLKSARIVTTSVRGEDYYHKAEALLKKNPQRFKQARSYRGAQSHGTFYIRQTRNGDTVELILLHSNTKTGTLAIVNLTGNIDEEFINSLVKRFGERTAKA